jgi:hypothetical protein
MPTTTCHVRQGSQRKSTRSTHPRILPKHLRRRHDTEFENADRRDYYVYVRRDYGTHFGHMLTDSGVCKTEEKAIAKLERILSIESRHARSGVPMTKAESIDCYGLKTGAALHKLNRILERDPTILERP